MFSSKPWNLFKMSHFYMAAVIIQRCESCLFPPLLVGRSWNKWLPIMGEFRFNFQKRGKALLETPKDRKQKKNKTKTARGRRREMSSVRVKDEAGREMEWSAESSECVSAEGGGSRSEWLGAAGGDVKISSSLVVTLSSTTCFLSFSFHSLPPSSSIVSFMTPPPPPSSSSPS